jgi:hypothetical protein
MTLAGSVPPDLPDSLVDPEHPDTIADAFDVVRGAPHAPHDIDQFPTLEHRVDEDVERLVRGPRSADDFGKAFRIRGFRPRVIRQRVANEVVDRARLSCVPHLEVAQHERFRCRCRYLRHGTPNDSQRAPALGITVSPSGSSLTSTQCQATDRRSRERRGSLPREAACRCEQEACRSRSA